MEKLFQYSQIKVRRTPLKFKRYLYNRIAWGDRLIGITGARGVGKTTIMLQRLRTKYGNSPIALYITLDDFYFTNHRLIDFAEKFYINGGRILFIDEVHRYQNWSIELKNIYDLYEDIKVVFSGSSALQLHKSGGDLSRRSALYHLHELSFREYLEFYENRLYKPLKLDEILLEHQTIAIDIMGDTSIIPLFKKYLKEGSYPFSKDIKGLYYERLKNTIDVIIENDLQIIENINYQTTHKLRQLIVLLADRVPFKVNISELSRIIGISRDSLLRLFEAMDRANLIIGIRPKGSMSGYLTKPDKVFLNNTSLLYALHTGDISIEGVARETFFVNQMVESHDIKSVSKGDFIIDSKYVFEIGGRKKGFKQIANITDSYIASDNLEIGIGNKIPLWLFGFLY